MFSTISNQLSSFRDYFTGKTNPTEEDVAFLKVRVKLCSNIDPVSVDTLLVNLFKAGIRTPNDCQMERLYFAGYSTSNANHFFGSEGWSGENTPAHPNYICIVLPADINYNQAYNRLKGHNFYVLHSKNFAADQALDVDFVNIIRNGFQY